MSKRPVKAAAVAPHEEVIPTARPATPSMSVHLSNALLTGAPISEAEMRCIIEHAKALHALLIVSGPRFSNAARDAIDLHNRAIRRLRGMREEAWKQRAALDDDERLLEIA